ncbi:GIGYF1 [Cordylochernes scorpioides]|uniref:GIGYF1 n=1 Tax=Cordylochernes scorpioides TaxID=51811 RepID=A0ABY6KHU6_9ARAC|nr:GIGYF1 [Cordylochernes scorpioides]
MMYALEEADPSLKETSCHDASCKKAEKCLPTRFEFDRGRIVAYRDCGLLIAACVGRDTRTASRIDGSGRCHKERHTGSQWPAITDSRGDRHVTCMALVDRIATSRALSQEMKDFSSQKVPARTVKPERRNGVRSCFQTNPGSVCSTMMAASVFGAIMEKTHGQRAFNIVILLVVVLFIRGLGNATFQKGNALPHVAGIVRTFLHIERFRLLPTRSPDLSPIENVWSMVAAQLSRHHTPVTIVDEL